MGVSGFLISWANRRATSPQAWARWADTISEMSSNTSKRAWLGKTAPRATNVVLLFDVSSSVVARWLVQFR